MTYGNRSCHSPLNKVREIVNKTVDVSFSMPIVTFVRSVTNDMKGRKEHGEFWLLHFPFICGAVSDFEWYRYVHQEQKRRLSFLFQEVMCV